MDEKFFEPTKPSNLTNNHATASPNAKRKRLEPSSLTEQEQIEIAIGMCFAFEFWVFNRKMRMKLNLLFLKLIGSLKRGK